MAPPIEVFAVSKAFTDSTHEKKVNLSVGGKDTHRLLIFGVLWRVSIVVIHCIGSHCIQVDAAQFFSFLFYPELDV